MLRTPPFRPPLPAALLTLTLASTLLYSASAQTDALRPNANPDATFRTEAAEVRITFSTTDQNDRVMATVQKSDFAVVDRDVVVRDFRSFARSEYTRLKIALLVDTSASVTPQFRQEVSNVLQVIGETSGVPEQDVSVISFHKLKPVVVCAGNCRSSDALQQFLSAKNDDLTPLYDSALFASHLLADRHDDADGGSHVRKALVLFSDGLDTISLNSFPDVMQEALQDDITIYAVDVNSRAHDSRGSQVLLSLALKTGGRYFPMEVGSGKIVDAILQDFRATYTVAYKLPSYIGGFHEVRILPTHNLGLRFHCRLGYYYSSNAGD